MMRCPTAGPMPSSVSSCSSDAELSETGAAGDAAPPAPAAGAGPAPRRGTTTCSPSASRAARLSASRSARRPGRAFRTASSTRAPAGSRYTPARRTSPLTSTTTTCGSGLGASAGTAAEAGGYAPPLPPPPVPYLQPIASTRTTAAAYSTSWRGGGSTTRPILRERTVTPKAPTCAGPVPKPAWAIRQGVGPHHRAMSTQAEGIRLQGLEKSFSTPQGVVRAVDGIDVAVAAGETVALLGPNGAGKTTTIDMVLGLLPPDGGAVSLFGKPPADAIAAGGVGAMLQMGSLLPYLSVRELLTMMAALYPSPMDVDEVIEIVGLGDIVGRMTHRLSGGQTQRVRFAIALVSNPDLLVLDEPTVAMDVEGRHAFWTTMRGFAAGGKTVIFATHYLDEADDYADRAVLMARGKIVADGPTTEIKAMVGGRRIRATLPHADLAALEQLAGVLSAERRGEAIVLRCSDSDQAIRALLATHADVRDIEITGAGLEEAFLELTTAPAEAAA